MKMARPSTAEDYRVFSSFEEIRKTLQGERFAERLNKPIAFWALPNDRRLPLALFGRTVNDLLATPFDELTATRGIGQKKVHTLVTLLKRVTEDTPPGKAMLPSFEQTPLETKKHKTNGKFEPSVVSEALWTEWRDVVSTHRFGCVKLGRLAASLRSLPTVIWHTPLEFYLDKTLAEIRSMRTHGEKRVHAVLEVFFEVTKILSALPSQSSLTIRLVPKRIQEVEDWIDSMLDSETVSLSANEVNKQVVNPLIEQIRNDLDPMVADLVEGRLGIGLEPQSVRSQSREVGVTRARIYQLYEDCAKVMKVRWPEGEAKLKALTSELAGKPKNKESTSLLTALCDLCYPDRERSPEQNGDD